VAEIFSHELQSEKHQNREAEPGQFQTSPSRATEGERECHCAKR
jgi:hypothetical protein